MGTALRRTRRRGRHFRRRRHRRRCRDFRDRGTRARAAVHVRRSAAKYAATLAPVGHATHLVVTVPHLSTQSTRVRCVIRAAVVTSANLSHEINRFIEANAGGATDVSDGVLHLAVFVIETTDATVYLP